MYTYNLTMKDSTGNGWTLSAQFFIHSGRPPTP